MRSIVFTVLGVMGFLSLVIEITIFKAQHVNADLSCYTLASNLHQDPRVQKMASKGWISEYDCDDLHGIVFEHQKLETITQQRLAIETIQNKVN